MDLSHLDRKGRARMVDVSEKTSTSREAVARGEIRMRPATLELISAGGLPKGDVLAAARIAGILAAKETGRLIPLCHPLNLTGSEVRFRPGTDRLEIEARVRTVGPTGVEMEALAAVSIAALTVYDMVKAVDRDLEIGRVRLIQKSGGRSGDFHRAGEEVWEDD